ncbi:MAG: phosphopentomutase [Clostridia bacterium]|nr:phosphopentomutase [Clostridia bacterium]
MKRVFLIVLDSVGIGALPDAHLFGDEETNTLLSCYKTGLLSIPNMINMGLSHIEGCHYLGTHGKSLGAYGRCREMSAGKDTTTGHWEIAGLCLENPFPTYPDGFPAEIISEFEKKTGRKVLCNKPYSGTDVIRDFGQQHMKSGDLIVYTSADSVFQIAAHEDVVPTEKLYEYCRIAREILTGEHSVGRVIARPFIGKDGEFTRTNNRRDFSLEPFKKTLLDLIKNAGFDCISVGKINDVFASCGITLDTDSHGNEECMQKTLEMLDSDFRGLCFVNLVDFDSSYGHRNNAQGYAQELNKFDIHLSLVMQKLREDDLLIITADHGCDPGDVSTDHTREYTPLLVYGKKIKQKDLGTRKTFSDIAASIAEYLGIEYDLCGKSFMGRLI